MVSCGVAFWGCGFLIIAGVVSIALGRAVSSLTQRRNFPTRAISAVPATVGAFVVIVLGCIVFYVWCSNDFYCDRGFADSYRIPLKYPYQISAIDSLDEGCLGIWPSDGSCILWGITHYAVKESVMVGRTYSRRFCPDCPEEWFSFSFDTGVLESYSEEQTFVAACKEFGFTGEPALKSIREHYGER